VRAASKVVVVVVVVAVAVAVAVAVWRHRATTHMLISPILRKQGCAL
jgi:flagellar biosynthesis/type III secretory pathway M-ring protein FliF/YscJ